MLIDHIGAVCILRTPLSSVESWQMAYVVCRLIGRLSFPLIAYLLYQGFLYSHDRMKYFMRLLAVALVSEIPFDLALFGKIGFSHQNTCFTLAFSLLLLMLYEKLPLPGQIALCILVCILATLAHLDYAVTGPLLVSIFFWFRENRRKQCIAGSLLMLYELTAVFAFILISRYNGQYGDHKIPRWGFYLFYPMHLLALYGICVLT